MLTSLLLSCCLLMQASVLPTNSNSADDTLMLFEFESIDEAFWQIVNDGVMGGRSKGMVRVENGVLRFSGMLVTRGGGFTSVRANRRVDLSAYDGIELRVRGSGRTFEVEVDDNARRWGRSVSRRGAFETTSEWTWVRVPFNTMRTSIFGRPVRAAELNRAGIEQIGLYILDGIDGEFLLEVDAIRAYRDDTD